MEQSRLGVFLILIIIILLAPDGNSPSQRHEIDDIIAREKVELETLRNSTFGKPGNLTGVGDRDGLVPPEFVKERVRKMREGVLEKYFMKVTTTGSARLKLGESRETQDDIGSETLGKSTRSSVDQKDNNKKRSSVSDRELPFYRNTSGTIHGEWNRLELPGLQVPQTNLTYHKNITTNSGKVTFNIEEKQPGEVQEVGMTMVIKNPEGGDSQDITLYGVHFTNTGEMVLATSSERFAGIFALPHFTLTNESYNLSKTLLLSSISAAIEKQEDSSHSSSPWQSGSDQFSNSDPRCEYIVYLQFHPLDPPDISHSLLPFIPIWSNFMKSQPMTPDIIHQIEQELRRPTGAPIPAVPPIILSSIIYSPTCGFVLSTKNSKGLKVEKYYDKASNFALSAAAVMVAQIWLLIRQMNESNTPSTVSRVSFWTMAMMSVVDGYLTIAFLAVAIFVDSCFLPLVSAAFFSFLLVSVFGMRFLITIYRVQRPERRATQQTPAANTALNPAPHNIAASGLPAPVTATPQTPIILPPNQDTNDADDDGRQDIGMLYSRFYFVLLGSIFLSLHATSWPPFFRNIFMNIAVILANSFWIPQVYRNVMRGCRKAFTWEFVAGMSFCRVLPVIYIYCWRGNIFYIEPDIRVAAIIIGWVWFQVCALVSQEMFGPRFLIPSNLLPPAYDYHPILPINDLEATDPQIPTSPSTTPGERVFDCAICMQLVEVPTISSERDSGRGGGGGVGLLGRRGYMVTPCKHVFHSNCLEGWMRFRLQCPICRNPLPPL